MVMEQELLFPTSTLPYNCVSFFVVLFDIFLPISPRFYPFPHFHNFVPFVLFQPSNLHATAVTWRITLKNYKQKFVIVSKLTEIPKDTTEKTNTHNNNKKRILCIQNEASRTKKATLTVAERYHYQNH